VGDRLPGATFLLARRVERPPACMHARRSAYSRRPRPARPARSCLLLAVSAVSGFAKRPCSGLALTQRTRPISSCSEEDEPQLGGYDCVIFEQAIPRSAGSTDCPQATAGAGDLSSCRARIGPQPLQPELACRWAFVVPAISVCQCRSTLAAVRGRCCISALYLLRLTPAWRRIHPAFGAQPAQPVIPSSAPLPRLRLPRQEAEIGISLALDPSISHTDRSACAQHRPVGGPQLGRQR
jgi:hypothetical protein